MTETPEASTPTIFTKIINDEIPSHKVYEDERTFVFMDINPVQPGHCLVIPKAQVAQLWDLDAQDYEAVMATAKKVAHALRASFPDKHHVGLVVEGLDVPHTHLHLIPFNTAAEFHNKPDRSREADHDALAALAQRIAQNI